jgi:hypothetical protein
MRGKDISTNPDGWRYTVGAIEIWVTRFARSSADVSDPGSRRQESSAAVRVALGRDESWQDIGRIVLPWGLSYVYLELGVSSRETSLCLHARTEDTAAAALPYLVGYAAHVFEVRPAGGKHDDEKERQGG